MSERKILGVDLDNVISDTDSLIRSMIYELFEIKLEQNDITDFLLSNCCITEKQSNYLFEIFHEQRCSEANPIEGAVEILKKITNKYEIHIVTSRPEFTKEKTVNWLVENNVTYERIDFCNDKHNSPIAYDTFIEDNPETVYNMAKKGIRSLLYDYPWNQNLKEKLNIFRVFSWDEIYTYLIDYNQ